VYCFHQRHCIACNNPKLYVLYRPTHVYCLHQRDCIAYNNVSNYMSCIQQRFYTSVLYTTTILYQCIVYNNDFIPVYCIQQRFYTSVLYTTTILYQCKKCGNKALDLLLAPWQHYIAHPCIGNTPTTWYYTTYLGHAGPKCHGARKLGV
jgi:hypothetical protein